MNITLELNQQGIPVPIVFKVTEDKYVSITFAGKDYDIDRDELIRLGQACLPLTYTSPVPSPNTFSLSEKRKYYR